MKMYKNNNNKSLEFEALDSSPAVSLSLFLLQFLKNTLKILKNNNVKLILHGFFRFSS